LCPIMMNGRRMHERYATIVRLILVASFTLVAAGGCGGERDGVPDISYLYGNNAGFLTVTNGMSFADVRDAVGGTPRHGFTVQMDGVVYTLIAYDFDNGANLSLVFRDGSLSKVIQPRGSPDLLEQYPYMGTTATRLLPWTTQQAYDLLAVPALDTPPLPDETIATNLAYQYTGEDNIPPWVMRKFRSQVASQTRDDYATNRQLIQKYNGLRVQIGMTVEQVEKLFGRPLHMIRTKEDGAVGIYGEDIDLAVSPLLAYTCVAVVFREHRILEAPEMLLDAFQESCRRRFPGTNLMFPPRDNQVQQAANVLALLKDEGQLDEIALRSWLSWYPRKCLNDKSPAHHITIRWLAESWRRFEKEWPVRTPSSKSEAKSLVLDLRRETAPAA
jgi:hypothetical protein